MSFFNEVEYVASKVLQDGNEVIVKSKASASSSESYEDAWLKARDIAKEKAESQLTNLIKSVEEKESNTELIIKGIKGEMGFQGPRGLPGKSGVDGKDLRNTELVLVNQLTISENTNRIFKKIIGINPANYPTSLDDSISPLKLKILGEEFKKIIDAYPVKYNSPETQTQFVQAKESEIADIQDNLNSFFSSNEDVLTNAAKIGLFKILQPNQNAGTRIISPVSLYCEDGQCEGTPTDCIATYSSYYGDFCPPSCCGGPELFSFLFDVVLLVGLFCAQP